MVEGSSGVEVEDAGVTSLTWASCVLVGMKQCFKTLHVVVPLVKMSFKK